MIRKLNDIIVRHVQSNALTYFLVILFFMIGISSGAFMSEALTEGENKELIAYLQNFFRIVDSKDINNFSILKQSLLNNFQTGIVICVFRI